MKEAPMTRQQLRRFADGILLLTLWTAMWVGCILAWLCIVGLAWAIVRFLLGAL
jgi:hypothetical protein